MPEMHLRQPGFMHSACGLFKGKKTKSDKEFAIASNPKYDGYQQGLASIVYKLFESC